MSRIHPAKEFRAIIDALSSLLRWQNEQGFPGFPAEVRKALESPAPPPPERPTPPKERLPTTPAPQVYSEPGSALDALRREIGVCTRCALAGGRKNLVFGEGHPQARLMFVGEGPGEEEDLQGRPFVGAAGQLLDRMIKAMGLTREEVYIANIVKCRPPHNRNPLREEAETCLPYLNRQIEIIKPQVLCALGSVAAQHLLRSSTPISRLRGVFQERAGIPLMPTFHPAFLLRSPEKKKEAWADLKQIMERLDLKPKP